MSAANLIKQVLDQVQVQLKNINGGDDYNYNVKDNNIIIGYRSHEAVRTFPFICTFNPWLARLRATDQITFDCETGWWNVAYIKDHSEPLQAAVKLFSDIEKVIFDNPELRPASGDNLVYGLGIDIMETSSINDIGIVTIKFTASGFYTHY